MRIFFLLALTTLFLAFACNKKASDVASSPTESKPAVTKMMKFGENGVLQPGESIGVEQSDVTFAFVRMLSESRCPTGVSCIQAGEATALVAVNDDEPQKITIGAERGGVRVPIEGGAVVITSLNPYPVARVKTPRSEMKLGFRLVAAKTMK